MAMFGDIYCALSWRNAYFMNSLAPLARLEEYGHEGLHVADYSVL